MNTRDLFVRDDADEFQDGTIRTFHTGTASTATSSTGSSSKAFKPSCYESHQPLLIGGKKVYGGSCGWPMVTNADVYVGLDHSMKQAHHYPWNDPPTTVSIFFPIMDGSAPKDVEEFKKMINWLAVQLAANKLIHIGCIGGHGRTGMVLAALVKVVDGIEDAITYVREHYCEKAVESPTQVAFLNKHFGVKEVPPSRTKKTHSSLLQNFTEHRERNPITKGSGGAYRAPALQTTPIPLSLRPNLPTAVFQARPVPAACSIWGAGITPRIDKPRKVAKMTVKTQEGDPDGDYPAE